jgi:hypothetical protein
MTERDLVGSGRNLIKVLFQHLPERNEENYENPQTGQPVFRPRFKLTACRIRVKNLTATLPFDFYSLDTYKGHENCETYSTVNKFPSMSATNT